MSREDPQMKIRLPADLKDQIEAAAKDSGRSMNAEIVARLEQSFGIKPDVSRLHPLEALFKAYQLRQSISSLQSEITSLSTQKVSLQNILGNTQLVANLLNNSERLHTPASEIENLKTLIRSLSDEIATKESALASMESELCDLEEGTPALFDKILK